MQMNTEIISLKQWKIINSEKYNEQKTLKKKTVHNINFD